MWLIDRALKSESKREERGEGRRFSFDRTDERNNRKKTQTFFSAAAAGAPAVATAAGLAPKKDAMERCPGGGGPLLRIDVGAMFEKRADVDWALRAAHSKNREGEREKK